MAMSASTLADDIKTALGFSDPTSDETKGLAKSIVEEIQAASTANAPGTVTGNAPPSGGPLVGGAASNGTILGMTGASLAGRLKTNMGKPSITPELQGMADAIVSKVMAGSVSFSLVTGVCSNTSGPPPTPGVLTGAAANGTISGIVGDDLALEIATNMGKGAPTPELKAMCGAIADHIVNNAVVAYALVTAVCTSGGGPITGGTASSGTIL